MGARNNRLLRFEMARIVRGRLLLALVAIFLMFAGVTFLLAPTLGGTYGLGRDTALVMMAYNSFSQFSMIVLGSVYAYAFSGLPERYLRLLPAARDIPRPSADGPLRFAPRDLMGRDPPRLRCGRRRRRLRHPAAAFAVVSSLLAVAFVLAFSCMAAVWLRNPMLSVLVIFVSFVVGSLINYGCYGLAFQTDSNSFSTFVMGYLLGRGDLYTHIASLPLDFSRYGVAIALSLSILWLAIATAGAALGVRRLAKSNGHWRSSSDREG